MITVRCFFSAVCSHAVVEADPQRAHAVMEAHYAARHGGHIDAALASGNPYARPVLRRRR